MMDEKPLLEERDGACVILTLNGPARRNPLAMDLRAALLEAFLRIEASREIRAVVLTGAGGNFCSGGDIASMHESTDLAAGRERFRAVHELARLVICGNKPVVAAVEGWAAGAGIGLAAACDTVIAASDARFVAGFGRIGLVADFGMMHTLPARMGEGRARNFLLYNDIVDANEGLRLGLVDQLAEPGQALAAALVRAKRLATMAPAAIAQTRAAFAKGVHEVLDWERDIQAALLQTADHAEGRAAFLEKRAPSFTGS